MSLETRKIGNSDEPQQQLSRAFPAELIAEVEQALSILPQAEHDPSVVTIGPITLRGEPLFIPYRIYIPEPRASERAALSDIQRAIINALYTRHHDGYVRERYLKRIIDSSDAWAIPFILQLLGEYVLEIILVLESRLTHLCSGPYAEFLRENDAFFRLLRSRVISYWNCYYRIRFGHLDDYPGYRVIKALEVARSGAGRIVNTLPLN